jgi:apolipoprotein N-acyltransferase
MVVLPEKFVGVAPRYADTALALLQNAARQHRVWVVAGVNYTGLPELRNTALVIAPDGQLVTAYDKVHLVPGWEAGYARGSKTAIVRAQYESTGVAICKDMDFPAWTRRYARGGVGVMLVPAWDFGADARLHARMAVMRGIEGGFSIVRAAQEGLLTVSDSRGRILAEASSASAPEVLLVAEVAPGSGRTIYSAAGDWFGWLAAGAAVLVLVAARHRAPA